ncbi:hypothetical protein [Octadecabacter temperatus]|uniref:hypothetical protein n=1 Tax=Octadecabacter temperatus TaxID=1458307 RepID=UPI0009411815|nr:hypothetical protein [Octadecabacter temperatus]
MNFPQASRKHPASIPQASRKHPASIPQASRKHPASILNKMIPPSLMHPVFDQDRVASVHVLALP